MSTSPTPIRWSCVAGIGYVIQQVGLFPHQMVLTNVMTVPLLYGESKATAKTRAEELMHLVGLDPAEFADRYPTSSPGDSASGWASRVHSPPTRPCS